MSAVGISESSELFRCVNERIFELASPMIGGDDLLWLICECTDDRCTHTMRMTRTEYDALRMVPGLYAVVPGHERRESEEHGRRELEEIVRRTDRYVLFRTLGTPATPAVARR